MKIFGRFLIAFLLGGVLATGCYEDKGNYDYSTPGDDIVVSRFDTVKNIRLTWAYDEQIEIEPGFRIVTDRVRETDLGYEWNIDGEVVSSERVLRIDPLPVGRHSGTFTVIDEAHGLRYNSIFTLVITSSFSEGWFILSDDGGKSLLSYVNLVDENTPGELVRDVYGEVNGEELGSDPRKIRIVSYDGSPVTYEWEVLQGSGSVSIDQATMAKIGVIDEEFVGGAAPAGFVAVDGFQRDGGSIVLSEDGKVYQRDFSIYNKYPVPHSGKYGSTPVYMEGGMNIALMNGFDHFSVRSYGHIPFALLYDKQNNRFLSIYGYNLLGSASDQFGVFGTVKIPEAAAVKPGDTDSESGLEFPDPAGLGDYTVQAMGARIAPVSTGGTGVVTTATNYILLKSTVDGKYYILSFSYKMNSATSVAIELLGFKAFPETEGFNDQSLFEVLIGGQEVIFYTAGADNNTLYAYDILDGTSRSVYTAPSRITALSTGVVDIPLASSLVQLAKTAYKDRMMVGTSTGSAALLDISESAVLAGNTPAIKTFTGLGQVVDMDFYIPKNAYCYYGY